MSQRGYTLMETLVAMSIFGVFLGVLFTLTAEMRGYEKRLPINYHRHPQVISVLARMKRDVQDGWGRSPYENEFGGYTASKKVLIVKTVAATGGVETVVWDFRTPGVVRRRAFVAGESKDWVARGLPLDFSQMEISALRVTEGSQWATHITAVDQEGQLAIDAILQPRATE
jgi:prepilin-type N-terminal cleavage/methylation domain-containing protein